MSDIELVTAWRRNDPKHAVDANAFWEKMGVLTPQEREARAGKLGVLAYRDGQLIAITSADIVWVEGVRQRFASIGALVDPQHWRKGLAARMTGRLRSILEVWSLENPDEKVMGYAAIVQGDFGERAEEPVWHDWGVDLTLVGYTPKDEQIRIHWFQHARVSRGAGKGDPG